MDGANPNYSSKKGVLYNKDKSALICYPEGKAGPFSIPESVTTIEKHAFSRCLSLTSLTIPNSINFIGKYAFSNCPLLTSLTIPNGVAEIKRNTFFNCTALTSVSLPDSITSIGARAFYKCKSLPSLTLSAGVTSIEQDALYDCSSLTEILVDGANPNYSSAKGLLLNKSGTLMILCPAGKSGNFTLPASVTTIGHHAFYNCALLTGVTLPDGVKTIKEYAFYLCTTLANVTLPDSLTSIERDAFDNCTLLANITIPDSVTSIKRGTFSYCSSLTHITLPKSITSIDYAAFYYCIALKKATFLGDAPVLEIDVFTGAHAQFKVYFTEGSAGFTTPTWNGYPSVAIPENSGLTVRQAVGNGTAKKSFGTVVVGQTGPARSITIANPGNTALTGLAITLGGDQPQDFIVTSPLGKSLAAGASATFKVSFKPTAAGTRRATLQIKAKGNLRSLTEIKLVGLGVNP